MEGIETSALTDVQLKAVQDDLGITAAMTEASKGVADAATAQAAAEAAQITADKGVPVNAITAGEMAPPTSNAVKAELENCQKGKIEPFESVFINTESYTSANDLINAISTRSEVWCQLTNAQGTALYNQHVLPKGNGGVLHVLRILNVGRAVVEWYSDDYSQYHYETSNSSAAEGLWAKDVKVSDLDRYEYKSGEQYKHISGAGLYFNTIMYANQTQVTITLPKLAIDKTAVFELDSNTKSYIYKNGTRIEVTPSMISDSYIIDKRFLRVNINYASGIDNHVTLANLYFTITFNDTATQALELDE